MVFDCDGVLIESNAVKTLAFGQTVDEFGQKAMDRLMNYHREHGGISRFKKFEWFYREVVKARRGERFSEDNVPWSEDLAGLVEHLTCNFDFN